ncbi:MAG: endonuclease [Prevotella sp.]|nr:endonuclease [Prevotella sp.]
MKHHLLRNVFAAVAMMASTTSMAQAPNNTGDYYKSADGLKGKALKSKLYQIIGTVHVTSYDGLWRAYHTTDVRPDGKLWDMYSNTTSFVIGGDEQGKSYSKEGDGYNREHSLPKSWFKEGRPMYSDAFHVVPSDGYVNNRRSNYPYGENNGERYKSNNGFGKLGQCTTAGGNGIVFEPNNEYKGDFARIYFYMATAYEAAITNWHSSASGQAEIFSGDEYKPYVKWQMDMLMRWSANDPVSKKEMLRNEAVYKVQDNRNPFVDYPGLEDYIWGDSVNVAFSYDHYRTSKPAVTSGIGGVYPGSGTAPSTEPDEPTIPDNPDEPIIIPDTPSEGQLVFKKITSEGELTTGSKYLIVYEDGKKALGEEAGGSNKYRVGADVGITNNSITTAVDGSNQPYAITLLGESGAYQLYNEANNTYLTLTRNANSIMSDTDASAAGTKWAISFSDGNATIMPELFPSRHIQYNTGSPRFACYTGSQKEVQLYKLDAVASGIKAIQQQTGMDGYVYSISGQKVGTFRDLFNLPKGIYIFNGKKYIVR